jgi:BlaI family transcriptional regulator, penicillinase repressor
MKPPNPTPGELAILRALWSRKAPMTVREVHQLLPNAKETAYTTVLKMMTIMAEKGLVRRDETERSHTYTPVHGESAVQSSLLNDLMQRAFSGSAFTLVQRALDGNNATAEELDAIAKLIAQAKSKTKRDS